MIMIMPDNAPIVVVLVIAIIVVAIVMSVIGAAKRRKMLQEWCQAKGLQFDAERHDEPGAQFESVEVMQQGSGRYGSNWCMGKWRSRQMWCFDYHYTTGSGKNRRSYNLSMLAIEMSPPLKPLTIRPEGLFDKIGEVFGAQEIHFESAEFNRVFHVHCDDRKWAYDALPARALELLLSSGWTPHIQYDNSGIVLWDGHLWSSQEIERAAELASGLLELIPKFAQEAAE